MLTISHVSKTFAPGTANEHLALDDISLHLAPGEFVTVIGSNGAGKSTLMNAVSGSFIVDKGRITLGGQDITFVKEHKRARIVGRLFQDPMKGTAPHMTLEENLALAYSRGKRRRFRRAVNAKDIAVFREALARFGMGLEDRMKTKVGLLSGGQRQAVTLLMCTIVPPRVLLLDEHTAALDPAAAEKVLAITREIVSREKLTTLMITHNIQSALSMGTHTIMMNAGRIVLDIAGEERTHMTVPRLLELYQQKSGAALDTDRILLTQTQ